MNSSAKLDRDESPSAPDALLKHSNDVFESLLERSADAILLYEVQDPQTLLLVNCNEAAVKLIGASNKQEVLRMRPEELSPPIQPDGTPSDKRVAEISAIVQKQKTLRFEWTLRRLDGTDVPIDISATAVVMDGKDFRIIISRDITERKKAERELLELNQSLERRVADRTAALATSEARFRALVEHSPEAIVVFDGESGRFLFGNQHACNLYGVTMAKLAELTPADVSPEFQPGGRRSAELAREKMDEALGGGTPVFEWIHRKPDGKLVPTEVRLLRLPPEGQNLIRASIIDNTERKRAEQALLEANRGLQQEIEHRTRAEESLKERVRMSMLNTEVAVALNAGADLRTMLQQCAGLVVRHLDVAFARVWTLNEATQTLELEASAGCYTHLDGPHSRVKVGEYKIGLIAAEKKAHLTNNVQTDERVSDKEWASREGMVAFAGYPLLLENRVLGVLALFARRPLAVEVLNTLGSVADALALGIEHKRAQAALAESEARFGMAFQASPIIITISRMSDRRFVLVNDAFVNWTGYARGEILGRDSADLKMWEHQADRDAFWSDLQRTGSVRERECQFCNRNGRRFMMLVSAQIIQLNHVPHMLALALDISGRKQMEAVLISSEARLRESEARFSVAFQASPVFISINRMSDEKYVLINDALVNWLGSTRAEVLGRTSGELGMWENIADRALVWEELHRIGSIRQRECRWRNRHGESFTILLSAETIMLNGVSHILSLGLDITQRKQAEVETLKALAREKELSQLKSNFVSMVSHEFRTPLGIIQSSAELLQDFYKKMKPAEREDQLKSITGNTRRMAAMMEEVLVLSRLDAGKLDFQPATLDLAGFCRRVVDEVLSATNRRCSIELSFDWDLQEAMADERLLGHIFTNLLTNAVKYSEPGEQVWFTVGWDGSDAVCRVRDKGVGISEEDQQQLFKPFYRGSNVGTRPGTGIGLLLVKRCAELHGGEVQIHSKIGEGTTVIVRLPLFQGKNA